MLIAILIFVYVMIPVASLFAACKVLALWLAFGKTNVFARMPIFLLGTAFTGFLFPPVESRQLGLLIFLLLSTDSILVVATSRLSTVARTVIIIISAGLLALFISSEILNWNELHSAWMVRTSLGISLVAALFSALRLAKVNVIQLVAGTNDWKLNHVLVAGSTAGLRL